MGGAESNVACSLAELGLDMQWVGRVGDDIFGALVLDTLGSAGVDVSAAVVDPVRPTGLYVKERRDGTTRVRYYRAGSAAVALGPEDVTTVGLGEVELVHLSGITPALSPSCHTLIETLLRSPRGRTLVSFDVNWRPALWNGRVGSVLLRELARLADIVFIGADESQNLWHLSDPMAIAAYLDHPPMLVVKHAEHHATLVTPSETTAVPSLRVEVVEPVGAGDAFAAGYLAATVAGLDPTARLRLGRLLAATALSTPGDRAPVPDSDQPRDLVLGDSAAWERARVSPRGRVEIR